MGAELTLIKTAYEEENMTPEQIADCQGLDLTAVKAGLMNCSVKYRRDCGQEEVAIDKLNFSDDELERVNQVILDLALSAEDQHLRFKAATYVRDDKKGRKDVVNAMKGSQFNILMINEQLKKVREVRNGLVASSGAKGDIDV